ncbi:hypothetical protein JMM81_07690 [Bacillus sp. V3B]|uniref:hypothetical protein n=1 Tax=Bacillus sp. V3B TaxID=2804915 RepID=UPI00210BB2CC|nr:hypothetical protein [Bacillus sp. V3B]MCQ6274849.1 hypothetical protein [Bacillus sp. V3B]
MSSSNHKVTHNSVKFVKSGDNKKFNNFCKGCGSHDSFCNCKFKAPERKEAKPLNSDCTLVNSVVCSEKVQKVAELTLPLTAFGIEDLDDICAVNVVPNTAGITQNVRVIKDKVVNIGTVPVTITITLTTGDTVTLTTSLPFQAHTDCPGACPEDLVQETPLEVEGIFVQPGVPVVVGEGAPVTGILFKIILRTSFVVVRPVIVDKHGDICDVVDRCDSNGIPSTIFLPAPPNVC